ncbi:phosphate ABC transporter substrate-binding protein [Methanobacterium alkalithermotolerans]|uniref:Phosphate ABC transporter substrate-binding protein n=1 Tax=Methanobacterium alkalithermotolerans TaxID=2731220 RepID=A0A8T8K821_9EURY|nr:phosphate ABC transporter substrate-binding protein [Methanobacterium alkalithermotolerans]QUH23705.1 phosphate ABC transporter substrate-binding protein [Methanobacterium alkalithermotolerans]RJS49728.1 MAG: phosphate-binding protein [Methanobacterium sp.]
MDSKYKIGIIITIIILGTYFMVNPGSGHESIQIAGSTSVQPVAEKLAQEYMKSHPDVKINVQGGGSGLGIRSTQQEIIEIGTSSKKLNDHESKDLTEYIIGKEGIVVAVNNKNTVDDLTIDQIRDIFSGKISNWKEVGGSNQEIHVIVREEGSGTRTAFEDIVMDEEDISPEAIVQSSTEMVKQAVKQDPQAIGFVSLAHLGDDVKALMVGGIAPTEHSISKGTYPIQRPFIFLVKGEPEGSLKEFIRWIYSSEGQEVIRSEKIVPFIANVSDDS